MLRSSNKPWFTKELRQGRHIEAENREEYRAEKKQLDKEMRTQGHVRRALLCPILATGCACRPCFKAAVSSFLNPWSNLHTIYDIHLFYTNMNKTFIHWPQTVKTVIIHTLNNCGRWGSWCDGAAKSRMSPLHGPTLCRRRECTDTQIGCLFLAVLTRGLYTMARMENPSSAITSDHTSLCLSSCRSC